MKRGILVKVAQAPHLGGLDVRFIKNILKTISCVILWYVLQSIGTYTKALKLTQSVLPFRMRLRPSVQKLI